MISLGRELIIEFEPTTIITLGYSASGDTVIFATGPLGFKKFFLSSFVNVRVGHSGKLHLSYFSKIGKQYCIAYVSTLTRELRGLECEICKFIELRGLGYKVTVSPKVLFFSVGYSHLVCFKAPLLISFSSVGTKNRVVRICSTSLSVLSQTIAAIKAIRSPGVYNERGVYEKYELARIKAGKKKKFS